MFTLPKVTARNVKKIDTERGRLIISVRFLGRNTWGGFNTKTACHRRKQKLTKWIHVEQQALMSSVHTLSFTAWNGLGL